MIETFEVLYKGDLANAIAFNDMKIEETRCFWDMILLSEESFDIFDKKIF